MAVKRSRHRSQFHWHHPHPWWNGAICSPGRVLRRGSIQIVSQAPSSEQFNSWIGHLPLLILPCNSYSRGFPPPLCFLLPPSMTLDGSICCGGVSCPVGPAVPQRCSAKWSISCHDRRFGWALRFIFCPGRLCFVVIY